MRQYSVSGHKVEGSGKGWAARRALPLPLLFAAIVIVSFLVFSGNIGKKERILCGAVAFHASEEMTALLNGFLDEGAVLKDALEKKASMGKSELEAIASSILNSRPFIIGVSIAPSAVVKYHFPEQGNESLIGHDLLSNPDRRDALTRSVELKAPVLSGPFESVEGGNVFFLRYPVFSGGRLWGFTSITADFGAMVESLGLEKHYPGFAFAFSDKSGDSIPNSSAETNDGSGAAERFLAGRKGAFNGGMSSAISLPGADWRIHVMPLAGWTVVDPFLYVILLAGLTGAALLFIIFYLNALKAGAPAALRASAAPDDQKRRPRGREEHPSAFEVAAREAREMEVREMEARTIEIPATSGPRDIPEKTAQRAIPAGKTITTITIPKRNGQEVKFLGPDVKGQLYMPDVLITEEPSLFLAQKDEKRPNEIRSNEKQQPDDEQPPQKPIAQPLPEEKPRLEIPTIQRAPRKEKAPEQRRQEFLFSLEEEPVRKEMAILVVDDSEANRDIMGRMLSLRGYAADFAASGEDALPLCDARNYDIIFMDCFMPGMDGYKTSGLLREKHPGMKARIVGMSARIGDQELERCRLSGMDALLAKPFTLRDLLAHMEKS